MADSDAGNNSDQAYMTRALELASQARDQGEVPVGAIVVLEGAVIGEGFNQPISLADPSAHAEMQAMRKAARRLDNYRLANTTLYVTLEPCTMCAGAMVHARIKRLVYGAADPKTGATGSVFNLVQAEQLNHQLEVDSGVMAKECGELLRDFFRGRR
ncbi:MAG: tRNA adenosine(34) deaminase TadA [Gammaproteobacteria bacterium]|nr:tRNA adenosine(34) deaminase TadA [Gammaproteobacteria bacterium]MCZ6826627.1 tRNA adenosine(34) deaminase TadA [Gammaproteobacteria bacterium]